MVRNSTHYSQGTNLLPDKLSFPTALIYVNGKAPQNHHTGYYNADLPWFLALTVIGTHGWNRICMHCSNLRLWTGSDLSTRRNGLAAVKRLASETDEGLQGRQDREVRHQTDIEFSQGRIRQPSQTFILSPIIEVFFCCKTLFYFWVALKLRCNNDVKMNNFLNTNLTSISQILIPELCAQAISTITYYRYQFLE